MSMFQQRHYVKIASILAQVYPVKAREVLVTLFAREFTEDNPKFSMSRFYAACLGEDDQ